MPKHFRPAGKKKEGNAAKYVTRSQAVKYLQVSLSAFRKLCILKGVFPRVPKKKLKGNHHSYYHMKDIMFIKYEPLLEKLRDIRTHERKVKKAMSKKNRDLAERLLTRKPTYTLDMLIKERYPKFIDALRDLDDCLSMVHLFAALPAVDKAIDGEKIPVNRIHNCRRLSHEWQAYVSRTHKLRKNFVSVKGTYYQAEIEGQKITWLTPHKLQQVLPEVDYRVLLTFLEFYETLLASVNHRLYNSINVRYPPILDPMLESLAADLYALSRFFDANTPEGTKMDESELRLAQLQQNSSNEPGALMKLIEDPSDKDEEDLETRECKNLFKNMTFFLSREVPRESLLFIIAAFGGTVSWEGEEAPIMECDQSITYQIVDRPTQEHKFLSRDYVQPQWVYDCVNARIILPTEKYIVGCIPPPHLSPFVDNEVEGHVPAYAEAIERLKAAERKEVLPLPGLGKEDLDPQSSLRIIERAGAIEAAKRNRTMSLHKKQYYNELKQELEGAKYSSLPGNTEDKDDDEGTDSDLDQILKDAADMSMVLMPRRSRNLFRAAQIGRERQEAKNQRLTDREKKRLDQGKMSE